MLTAAVSLIGIIFIAIQWSFGRKQKELKYGEVCNYYGFSEHRGFLMGVAAILIVIFHCEFFTEASSDIGIINSFFVILWQFNIGVEMFLVVSGIGLYFSFEKNKVCFSQYYTKRLLNVYLISLIVDLPYIICLNLFVEKQGMVYNFLEWTKLHNWMGKSDLSWYVAFVMVLYALYPLIYKLMKKLEKTKFEFFTVCAVCIFIFALCIVLYVFQPKLYDAVEIALTRVPIFIIGCYLGKFVYNKQQYGNMFYIVCIIGILLWMILTNMTDNLMVQRFSHCLLALAICVVLIPIAGFLKSKINFIYRFFAFCGSMSLEIYLVHMNVERFLFKFITKNGDSFTIPHYIAAAAISFVIAYLISKLRRLIINRYMDYCKRKNTLQSSNE